MKKILAIDNNNDNLIALRAILTDSFPDLALETALSGKKGVELASLSEPDVILLNITMSEMDSFEVCLQLKENERTRDIPVIFIIEMKEEREKRIKALEVGGEAFLYKPIDESELQVQIRLMLKIKELNNCKRDENERLSQLMAERTLELEQSQAETLKLVHELQESSTHFRTLADSGQALIWTSGIDKKCNYFNQPWLDFTGRSIEQELGDGWAEGVHPDDLQQCIEIYVTAFDRKEKFSMEYRVRHVSGEYRWIQDDGTPRYNSQGEFIGFIGHCLDITERKQVEDALKKGEAKFRMLFSQMSEGFALHELIYDENHNPVDYKILDINPAFEKEVGIQADNVKGMFATQLYGISPAPYIDIYAQVAETGKHQFFQTYFPPLDRHFQISAFSPYPGCFATIFTDITERVKSEEAISNSNDLLSKFILHSPIYTYIKEVTPDESKVLKASDNFIDMIGIPGSQMIGKNMYELFPPEFARKITAEDWEVASNDHLIQLDEELNGKYYLTIKYPIKQANRTLLAGYTIDITDRKLAEDAFKENEIRLREVNATKDKFFSIIAHDLKSPFNSILGLSNLLVEQMQERNYDGIEEYAGIIQKSSTIVFDLLINLLEWARLQTGRMEFSPEYVEIGSLINEAAELLRDSARGKSITISSEIPRKTLAFVDKIMIGAILRNLITNAVKFTRPGGQVVISVKQKVDELEICVQDNGVGIKRETIEKLFLIDETHTSLGTKNEKGTGLGLILCKEFIEKHDGKIWVESEVGKGSKFYFSIPKH